MDTNISYLGVSGVKQVKGLTVAFLDDGRFSSEAGDGGSSDALRAPSSELKAQLVKLTGDVDILLTCSWPSNVLQGVASVEGMLTTRAKRENRCKSR